QRLTTAPVPGQGEHGIAPVALRSPWEDIAGSYVEMVRPEDVARLMVISQGGPGDRKAQAVATRHGLFGLDLEKGVVLRGRLRGRWVTGPPERLAITAAREFRQFLDEPPPLGM